MLRLKALCAALLLSSPVAAAETYTIYLCTYVRKGEMPLNLLFARDKAGKTFTLDVPEGAENPVRVPVQVRPAGADASIFLFAISQRNRETGMVLLSIQARVPTAGGPSRIKVRARRFQELPSVSGTCEVRFNESLAGYAALE